MTRTVRARPLDPDPAQLANRGGLPRVRGWEVHHDIAGSAPGKLAVAPPADRIDKDVNMGPDHLLMQSGLDLALKCLELDDSGRLLLFGDVVGQPL